MYWMAQNNQIMYWRTRMAQNSQIMQRMAQNNQIMYWMARVGQNGQIMYWMVQNTSNYVLDCLEQSVKLCIGGFTIVKLCIGWFKIVTLCIRGFGWIGTVKWCIGGLRIIKLCIGGFSIAKLCIGSPSPGQRKTNYSLGKPMCSNPGPQKNQLLLRKTQVLQLRGSEKTVIPKENKYFPSPGL